MFEEMFGTLQDFARTFFVLEKGGRLRWNMHILFQNKR